MDTADRLDRVDDVEEARCLPSTGLVWAFSFRTPMHAVTFNNIALSSSHVLLTYLATVSFDASSLP